MWAVHVALTTDEPWALFRIEGGGVRLRCLFVLFVALVVTDATDEPGAFVQRVSL